MGSARPPHQPLIPLQGKNQVCVSPFHVAARRWRNVYQIWDGRQKVAVEMQKSLCEDRKTENLSNSMCIKLKISRVHVFLSKVSQVHVILYKRQSSLHILR